jgi:diaminohydroxyphosphoribosylaminopyrimidine deaminase/5-amino-6-(5-phosphoribosylamino)uracil reductase
MTGRGIDHAHMARALRLATRGLYSTDPNPRVGCVIVRDGEIVGEGWHAHAGEPHAEIGALAQAGESASGATAYVSLEPCCHHGRTPPCTDALLSAGIKRVVIATRDPNPEMSGSGERQLVDAGVEVERNVLAAEARALNVGFFQRMETGRPFVRSKIAASLDGRTALANGTSKWITGEAAREDVQRLRARSSAILTGSGTVVADDPELTARFDAAGGVRQPTRIVVDSRLKTPPGSRLLDAGAEVRIFCTEAVPDVRDRLEKAGAIVEVIESQAGGVSLPALMNRLAKLEINEVHVEAGPVLNGSLLQAGLLDELVVYMASHVLGTDGRGMFAIPELTGMSERVAFELVELRKVGADCRMTYRPAPGN